MRHPRTTLSASVAVVCVFPRGEKSFPRDARRIVDPRFFRLRIATGGLSLLDDVAARCTQARIDFLQFVLALDLDAEVVEARLPAAGRDGEIDSRIIEHPF